MNTLKEIALYGLLGIMIGMSIRATAGSWDVNPTTTGSRTTYYPTYNGSGIRDFDQPGLTQRSNGRLRTTVPGGSLPDLSESQGLEQRGRYTLKLK